MVRADQIMRGRYEKTGVWNKQVDIRNTERMKQIIGAYGWPTISMVGRIGSRSAWLLVQHADHDLKFQTKAFAKMKAVFKKSRSDIDPANIAYLTDHVLVNQDKKQIFGTQFYFAKSGMLRSKAIQNLKNANACRKVYGLRPIRNDLEAAKKLYQRRSDYALKRESL